MPDPSPPPQPARELDYPSDARRPPTREEHFVLEDLPERERMLWGALAYVCFPVSLYFGRWDPLVRFHVRQGAGATIGWVLAWVWHRFTFQHQVPELSWVGYVAVTVITCYGIRNAIGLEFRRMPWLGRLANRLPYPKRLAEPARVS